MLTVTNFIDHFHKISQTDNITEVFTQGCCYWFAHILCERFPEMKLMYNPILNHFMASDTDGNLFDITGEVTSLHDKQHVILWEEYQDETHKQRIIDQCIKFVDDR